MLLKLFLTFFKIGAFTFGGGYAMIPFVEHEAVEKYSWLTHQEFVDIISLFEATPGPIAVNMATFVGYKVSGVPGAIIATLGVVLPSLVIVTILASVFYAFKESAFFKNLLQGLTPAILALISITLISLIRTVTKNPATNIWTWLIFAFVFIIVYFFNVHPILAIVLAALFGFIV